MAAAVAANAARSALRLKDACTQVLVKYTPTVPPEAFLYRSNAYAALGQPYFAVADVEAAAAQLALSGRHTEDNRAALAALPPLLRASFPSTEEHTAQLVEPALCSGATLVAAPAAAAAGENRGRCVVAKNALAAGDVVIRAREPWLAYALGDSCCSMCAKPFGHRHFACRNPRCHEDYCSRECRTRAFGLFHARGCDVPAIQGLELDMYGQHVAAVEAAALAAASAGLVGAAGSGAAEGGDGDAAVGSSGGNNDSGAVTKLPPSRLVYEAAVPSQDAEVSAVALLTIRAMLAAVEANSVPSMLREVQTLRASFVFHPPAVATNMLAFYHRFVRHLGLVNSVSFEEFLGLFMRLRCNARITGDAITVTPAHCAVNHSCTPNAAINNKNEVVAVANVPAGSEVTLSWLPSALNSATREHRRDYLWRAQGFWCTCPRCAAGQ